MGQKPSMIEVTAGLFRRPVAVAIPKPRMSLADGIFAEAHRMFAEADKLFARADEEFGVSVDPSIRVGFKGKIFQQYVTPEVRERNCRNCGANKWRGSTCRYCGTNQP